VERKGRWKGRKKGDKRRGSGREGVDIA